MLAASDGTVLTEFFGLQSAVIFLIPRKWLPKRASSIFGEVATKRGIECHCITWPMSATPELKGAAWGG
jgi:hypothetical protein